MGKQLIVQGRLAFATLATPRALEGGAPRYSTLVLFEPDSDAAKAVREAMEAVARERWADKGPSVLAKLQASRGTCYRTEPRVDRDGEPYGGFEGTHHLSASSPNRPAVFDRAKRPVDPGQPGWPYSGCTANVLVDIWAQDNKYGRRINAALLGVQFVADGAPFGGGRPASPEMFPDLPVDTVDAGDWSGEMPF